uniref:Putative inter alpha-trypsin inhibitor, heavy chain 4 n=1 Tax=Davidia involucrata TaxID=16924 RepID=A0A5B7AJY8_DAVIN
MADDFVKAVDDGLRLSKRIYFGKDRSVAPPKPMVAMEKSSHSYLPTAPMVYAVISNPAIVDNPDIPSYQPHVHGRCDPPALLPLQMNGIALEADCYLDTALVTVTGSWRVHCVMGSRQCDCRVAIPMGEQGSILGVEVDIPRKSYSTQLIVMDEKNDMEKVAKVEDGGFLKPHIFTFTIPQVDGGSNLSIKLRWSQKLFYHSGQFSLSIPFSFPEYVTPAGKKISKKEKIQLNINSGPGTELLCKTVSHPLKELRRQVGKLGFLYESEVLSWSSSDFIFSYTVSSSHIFGGVLLQSPSVLDTDKREMFCFYLFPGNQQSTKVFRKEVVFVVDISASMRGKPLEDTKKALYTALSKLDPEDKFSIIAFNGETYLFSSSMELATEKAIENATQWINMNFIAGGGTNILLPLNQAIEMLSNTRGSIPIIFLITDGAVEDERHICDIMKSHLTNQGSICPRIYTFGIGSFCNHYFLRMLALIGRGHHDAAYDADSIDIRMEGLFSRASSTVLANLAIDTLDKLDGLEVYPSHLPDLLSESPLIVSGRYQGVFPDILKARGILADMSNFVVDLKVQEAKDIPLDKVLAKQQIDLLTSHAWFSENKELEFKIAKMSIQSGVVSEYTRMVLLETQRGKKATESAGVQEMLMLRSLGVGFGNLTATAENIPPGFEEPKLPDAAEIFVKAASNWCGKICSHCCCMCCINTCSRINDQCAIALTQLCGALACFGCISCCEACCSGNDG